jgi:CheY-like chemotaxis protein
MRAARVVLVDDEPNGRRILRLMLERDGHTVWEASCPEETVAVLEAQATPDLAIIDVHLGEKSGVDLLRQLRTDAVFGALSVLAYSGTPDRAAVTEAIDLGALGFLARPVDRNRLGALINKALADDWMRAHFEDPASVCRRLSTDRDQLGRLVHGFFADLRPLVVGGLESRAEHAAVVARLAALRQTAGDFGLHSISRALEQWERGSESYHVPPLLARWPAISRLYGSYTSR